MVPPQNCQQVIAGALGAMIVAGAVISCTTVPPSIHANDVTMDRMGSHGMVAIDNGKLLLYHLALYRRPHDRQILVPVSFVDAAEQAEYFRWRESYRGLVTIVPERFNLDRLDPASGDPVKRLSADIFEGHFERGGRLKFEAMDLELGTPLMHRAVLADAPEERSYTYIRHGDSAYLVKDIGPRPGMDRILSLPPQPLIESGARLDVLAEDGARLRLAGSDQEIVTFRADSVTELYLETQDFR